MEPGKIIKVEVKEWWKSSTLWLNAAGIATMVLDLVVQSNLIPDADVLAIVLAVLNILNRFRTKNPIT